jgi:arabinose-5-phosphate isomerase
VRDLMHKATRCRWWRKAARHGRCDPGDDGAQGFGCVGVTDGTGQLVGIVTDGDLRRHMRPDLMAAPVAEVMTRNPRTVAPDTLAVEALEMLNSRKITALFVVDADNRPCGLVHLHDLLP